MSWVLKKVFLDKPVVSVSIYKRDYSLLLRNLRNFKLYKISKNSLKKPKKTKKKEISFS
jgi:hypothetical protein